MKTSSGKALKDALCSASISVSILSGMENGVMESSAAVAGTAEGMSEKLFGSDTDASGSEREEGETSHEIWLSSEGPAIREENMTKHTPNERKYVEYGATRSARDGAGRAEGMSEKSFGSDTDASGSKAEGETSHEIWLSSAGSTIREETSDKHTPKHEYICTM